MKQPSLDDFAIFAAVARTRSFNKAAGERGVSGSAISQAIRGLEERLGVRLLNRTTRSVAVTEAGEQLLCRLQPALAEIADAVNGIDDFRKTPTGSVRINAPAPAVEFVLMPLVEPFLQAYPEVALEFVSDARLVDIVEDRFDAGVRFGEEVARDMIAVPLGPPLQYVVVGAPAYLERHGRPRDPSELPDHRCLGLRFPNGSIREWTFEREGRGVTFVPQGRLVVSDARHLVRAAAAGVGLAFVLENYVREPLATGQVVEVLGDWCAPLPSWFLYYPSRRQLPLAMRAFLNFAASRRGK